MAETKTTDEPPTLPCKRKPEFPLEDQLDHSNNKNPKLQKPEDHDSRMKSPKIKPRCFLVTKNRSQKRMTTRRENMKEKKRTKTMEMKMRRN